MIGTASIHLEVDGGITPSTAPAVKAAAPMSWSPAPPFSRAARSYAANIEALRRAAIEGAAGKS